MFREISGPHVLSAFQQRLHWAFRLLTARFSTLNFDENTSTCFLWAKGRLFYDRRRYEPNHFACNRAQQSHKQGLSCACAPHLASAMTRSRLLTSGFRLKHWFAAGAYSCRLRKTGSAHRHLAPQCL